MAVKQIYTPLRPKLQILIWAINKTKMIFRYNFYFNLILMRMLVSIKICDSHFFDLFEIKTLKQNRDIDLSVS